MSTFHKSSISMWCELKCWSSVSVERGKIAWYAIWVCFYIPRFFNETRKPFVNGSHSGRRQIIGLTFLFCEFGNFRVCARQSVVDQNQRSLRDYHHICTISIPCLFAMRICNRAIYSHHGCSNSTYLRTHEKMVFVF